MPIVVLLLVIIVILLGGAPILFFGTAALIVTVGKALFYGVAIVCGLVGLFAILGLAAKLLDFLLPNEEEVHSWALPEPSGHDIPRRFRRAVKCSTAQGDIIQGQRNKIYLRLKGGGVFRFDDSSIATAREILDRPLGETESTEASSTELIVSTQVAVSGPAISRDAPVVIEFAPDKRHLVKVEGARNRYFKTQKGAEDYVRRIRDGEYDRSPQPPSVSSV